MNDVSAEAANDRFFHFSERKDEGSYQHDRERLLERQMGREEDYLHRISMYIGNLQKSTSCNNNQNHKAGEQKYHKGGE
ncbi:MAG TPA: hypothetical protein VN666_09085 [Nitrospira sp.]|nr:hypothetical protein [Nitrospira sp.]